MKKVLRFLITPAVCLAFGVSTFAQDKIKDEAILKPRLRFRDGDAARRADKARNHLRHGLSAD